VRILTYKLREKKKRNQELFDYYELHKKEDYTFKEIGEHFNISAARAFEIIKQMKKVNAEV
jgi:predicted DNA-binding protein YlxM (UPF0122 family)